MTLKLKLILTACLTAFLGVVVGAVINKVASMPTPTPVAEAVVEEVVAVTETIIPTPLPTATVQVVDAAVVQEREAQYQAQLAEANARLALAARELNAAQSQARSVTEKYNAVVSSRAVAPTVAPTDIPAAPTVTYVPLDVALAAASALDPAAVLQRTPELVLYEGRAAYEIVFDRGTVYVSADDGSVMSNGLPTFETVSATNGGAGRSNGTVDAPTAVPEPTSVPAPTKKPEPTTEPAPPSHEDDDGEDHGDEGEHEDHHESEDSHDD